MDMKVCAISDLHGYRPRLKSGNLLIVAGDCTGRDHVPEWKDFFNWFEAQDYDQKIMIGGNHDCFMQKVITSEHSRSLGVWLDKFEYLCDNGFEYRGYKIWGTPWTHRFMNQNHCAMAFSSWSSEDIQDKFKLIPDDTEILITHTPQLGILDHCSSGVRVGSSVLGEEMLRLKNLKYHIFGHIHEGYGKQETENYVSLNCSHVNQWYRDINAPHYFELPEKDESQEAVLQVHE